MEVTLEVDGLIDEDKAGRRFNPYSNGSYSGRKKLAG